MGKKREVANKKIIMLGDKGTGKTTLLQNIKNGPNYIMEQIMGNKYELKAKSKSKVYTRITIWDGIVSGYRTDYRPIAYKNTDLIILLYSIDSYKSFNNLAKKWLSEAQTFSPDVNILVIGNKKESRLNDNQKTVSYEDGSRLAEDIKAVGFLECSAFDEEGLNNVVQTLLKTLTVHESKSTGCLLM